MEQLTDGFVLESAPGVFPLGQDSVLLANFARPAPHGRALDLGSGTGVLSILLLARFAQLHVTALECNPEALALTCKNRDANGLGARMDVLPGDVREYRSLLLHASMDFVICNPPYFDPAAGKSHASLSSARQQTCGIEHFTQAAAFALRQRGRCAFVYRPERLSTLFAALSAAAIAPKRMRFVHQRLDKPPSAVLVEGMKGAKEGLMVLPPLLIETPDGGPTNEYKKIYHL